MTAKDSFRLPSPSVRLISGLSPAVAVAVMCLWSSPAAADFRLCNNTSSRVGIALGFATMGRVGFDSRGGYAAVGPVVNQASRLCDL